MSRVFKENSGGFWLPWLLIVGVGVGYFATVPAVYGQELLGRVPAEDKALGRTSTATDGPRYSPQSLLLLVRTNPETTATRIEETLKLGVQQADCRCTEIVVREVPPQLVDQIEAILRMLDYQEAPISIGDITLLLRHSQAAAWEIRLKTAPKEVITKLTVVHQSGSGNQEVRAYEPVALAGPEAYGLIAVSVVNGIYEFRPDPKLPPPCEYELILLSEDGKERTLKGRFPVADRCYMIHLVDFQGDRDRLFAVVKDKNKVANPFSDIRERSNVALIFGNINAQSGTTGATIVGVNLLVSVTGVTDRVAARVWMLFPLTEEEAKKECSEIDALQNPSLELPEIIRQRAVAAGKPQKPVIELDQPLWYELASTGSGFEGQVRLVNDAVDYARLREKYPRVFRLLVWEFEDPTNPKARGAIYVEQNRVYKVEEMLGWSANLERAEASVRSP